MCKKINLNTFEIRHSIKHEGKDQSESNHTSVVQSKQHLYTCNYTLARWLAIVFMVSNPYQCVNARQLLIAMLFKHRLNKLRTGLVAFAFFYLVANASGNFIRMWYLKRAVQDTINLQIYNQVCNTKKVYYCMQ